MGGPHGLVCPPHHHPTNHWKTHSVLLAPDRKETWSQDPANSSFLFFLLLPLRVLGLLWAWSELVLSLFWACFELVLSLFWACFLILSSSHVRVSSKDKVFFFVFFFFFFVICFFVFFFVFFVFSFFVVFVFSFLSVSYTRRKSSPFRGGSRSRRNRRNRRIPCR